MICSALVLLPSEVTGFVFSFSSKQSGALRLASDEVAFWSLATEFIIGIFFNLQYNPRSFG